MMSFYQRFKEWLFPNTKKYDEEELLYKQLTGSGCPDCGNQEFEEGPSASISVNIRCSNPECHSEFNIAPMMRFAERIRYTPKD